MQIPASISVALNMLAANVVRSPSCEKLLLYQYGSSDVNPAVAAPEITKRGSKDATVFASRSSACTRVAYPTIPERAEQNTGK